MDEKISFGSRKNWNRTPMASRHRVRRHILWFLYNSLELLEQPFTLDELGEAIKLETGVKPKASSILRAVASYYEESQTPLIYRAGHRDKMPLYASDLTMYGLNHNPFLPPLDRKGRRRKRYTENDNEFEVKARREWDKYYARLRRHPEIVAKVFESVHEADLDYISKEISKLSEGVCFGEKAIQSALKRYMEGLEAGIVRGPPIQEDPKRPGFYRKLEDAD